MAATRADAAPSQPKATLCRHSRPPRSAIALDNHLFEGEPSQRVDTLRAASARFRLRMSGRHASLRVARRAGTLLKATVGVAAIALLLGSAYWHGLLLAFDATWLFSQVPQSRLLKNSIPVSMFLVLIGVYTDAIARRLRRDKMPRMASSIAGVIVTAGLFCLALWLGRKSSIHIWSGISTALAMFGLGAATVVVAAEMNVGWARRWSVAAWCVSLSVLLIALPAVLGYSTRVLERSTKDSRLPFVELSDSDSKDWRLLLLADNTFYLVRLGSSESGSPPSIRPVSIDSIVMVRPRSDSK